MQHHSYAASFLWMISFMFSFRSDRIRKKRIENLIESDSQKDTRIWSRIVSRLWMKISIVIELVFHKLVFHKLVFHICKLFFHLYIRGVKILYYYLSGRIDRIDDLCKQDRIQDHVRSCDDRVREAVERYNMRMKNGRS